MGAVEHLALCAIAPIFLPYLCASTLWLSLCAFCRQHDRLSRSRHASRTKECAHPFKTRLGARRPCFLSMIPCAVMWLARTTLSPRKSLTSGVCVARAPSCSLSHVLLTTQPMFENRHRFVRTKSVLNSVSNPHMLELFERCKNFILWQSLAPPGGGNADHFCPDHDGMWTIVVVTFEIIRLDDFMLVLHHHSPVAAIFSFVSHHFLRAWCMR